MKQLIVASLLASAALFSSSHSSSSCILSSGLLTAANAQLTDAEVCPSGYISDGAYIVEPPSSASGGGGYAQTATNCRVAANTNLRYISNGMGGNAATDKVSFAVIGGEYGSGSIITFASASGNTIPLHISVTGASFLGNAHVAFREAFSMPKGSSVTISGNVFAGSGVGTSGTYASPVSFAPVLGDASTVLITGNTVTGLGRGNLGTGRSMGLEITPSQVGAGVKIDVLKNNIAIADAYARQPAVGIAVAASFPALGSEATTCQLTVSENIVTLLDSAIIAESGVIATVTFPTGVTAATVTCAGNTVVGDYSNAGLALMGTGGGAQFIVTDNRLSSSRNAPALIKMAALSPSGNPSGRVVMSVLRNTLTSISDTQISLELPTINMASIVTVDENTLTSGSSGASAPYILFAGSAYSAAEYSTVTVNNNKALGGALPSAKLIAWPAGAVSEGYLYTCANTLNTVVLSTLTQLTAATTNLPSNVQMSCIENRDLTTTAAPPRTTVFTGAAPHQHQGLVVASATMALAVAVVGLLLA